MSNVIFKRTEVDGNYTYQEIEWSHLIKEVKTDAVKTTEYGRMDGYQNSFCMYSVRNVERWLVKHYNNGEHIWEEVQKSFIDMVKWIDDPNTYTDTRVYFLDYLGNPSNGHFSKELTDYGNVVYWRKRKEKEKEEAKRQAEEKRKANRTAKQKLEDENAELKRQLAELQAKANQ